MHRFLSKREKDSSSDSHFHRRQKSKDKSSDQSHLSDEQKSSNKKNRELSSEIIGLFKHDSQNKVDTEQDVKINLMRDRLAQEGLTHIDDKQLQYGLFSKYATGDVDKAVELVRLFQESVEGVIRKYDPEVEMQGAVNYNGVTCWLDSILFSMFAHLPSFEPMLYTVFEDEPRRRLSTLLRLWVNMMRTGMLIDTDITSYILKALSDCGWEEAKSNQQQDASEAFSFITEKLLLPLLTLKMDLYHDGIADPKDDHKRVCERLLEVAIPEPLPDGRVLTLENCLEDYFNNRVEVKRVLELSHQAKLGRSNTVSSSNADKGVATHVEVSEISSPSTPIAIHPSSAPIAPTPTRNQSIIRRRLMDEQEETNEIDSDKGIKRGSTRRQTHQTEVMMPAWQMISLMRPAWYTRSALPQDNIASHFAQARPVLGICLKRYSMTMKGDAIKNSAYIDIPLEIKVPNFVRDDTLDEDEPMMGNLKLSLQSVICHQGEAVHRGHYFSYIRASEASDGDCASNRRMSSNSLPPSYPVDRWIRHNDAETPKIEYVDITKALKESTPYMLFYQIQPIAGEGSSDTDSANDSVVKPPSYDSGIDIQFTESSPRGEGSSIDKNPYHAIARQQEQERERQQPGYFDSTREENITSSPPSIRLSSDMERPRNSMILPEDRRGSIAFTDTSLGSAHSVSAPGVVTTPVTPVEENAPGRMSRATSRFRVGSRSRPTSASGEREGRFSSTFSRFAARSREQLNKMDIPLGKDSSTPIPATDGALDNPVSISVDEVALKPPTDMTPSRKSSKKGRRQSRQEKLEKKVAEKEREKGENHQQHDNQEAHAHARFGKQGPMRECQIM